MTDATAGESEAPPKKRTFFKKAAWQTAAKPEKEKDIFSHADTFKDIVAEEVKRKREAREKAQAEKKRHAEEAGMRKKRKVSEDGDESTLPSQAGSGSSIRTTRMGSTGPTIEPLSPTTNSIPDSLSRRYESLTKSSFAQSSFNNGLSQSSPKVVDISDTESDTDIRPYSKTRSGRPLAQPLPKPLPKPTPSEEIEEVDDPAIAALKARARAKAAKESEPAAPRSSGGAPRSAIVQLLISSEIPNTAPLLIKIKTDTKIEKPWEAWCGRQGFSKEMMEKVFLTWKRRQIYISTTIARLGVTVDPNGFITVEDDPEIYDETNIPRIHLEAWTKDLLEARKKADAEEAAAKKKAEEPAPEIENEAPAEEPAAQAQKIRLYLKAKGKEEFRICVYPDTTVSHLTAAYKTKMNIPKDKPITLMFDGERLKTMDTMVDADIGDEDSIEVHFK